MVLIVVRSLPQQPQLINASFIPKPLASDLEEAVRCVPRVSHYNQRLYVYGF